MTYGIFRNGRRVETWRYDAWLGKWYRAWLGRGGTLEESPR